MLMAFDAGNSKESTVLVIHILQNTHSDHLYYKFYNHMISLNFNKLNYLNKNVWKNHLRRKEDEEIHKDRHG